MCLSQKSSLNGKLVFECRPGMTDRQTDTLRNLLYKLDVIIIFAHGDLNHILMFKSG